MDATSQQFIDFMYSIHGCRTDLNNHLNADPERLFVYFLAPLSNVLGMRESGIILPRNRAEHFHDLSDQSIQENREKVVRVQRNAVAREVLIHDCVNTFINPINSTLFAFRRNARIREDLTTPLSSVVGIIELDLSSILNIDNVSWHVSMGNLAGNVFDGMEYHDFPWPQILSIHYDKDSYDSFRSSEFLVYTDGIQGIPFNCVNRVLVLPQDLTRVDHNNLAGFQISEVVNDQRVFVFRDELHDDRQFWDDERRIVTCSDGIFHRDLTGLFTRSLDAVARTERQIGLNLRNSFVNQEIATDFKHGVVHVVRVMFWIHVLAEIYSETKKQLSENEIKAMMYAGFFHDSCRENDEEDEKHGKAAADRYKTFIRKEIHYPDSDRCILAIEAHSKQEDPLMDDVMWKIVKDADALDRGRFGGIPNSDSGCKQSFLRLPFLKTVTELSNNILWAAYFLPKVTKYIIWNENSCEDFAAVLHSSRRCVIGN
jgi:hypothetical protein